MAPHLPNIKGLMKFEDTLKIYEQDQGYRGSNANLIGNLSDRKIDDQYVASKVNVFTHPSNKVVKDPMCFSSKINEDSEFEEDVTFSMMPTNEMNSSARVTAKFKFNPKDAMDQRASPHLVTAKNFNLKSMINKGNEPNLNKTSNLVTFRNQPASTNAITQQSD